MKNVFSYFLLGILLALPSGAGLYYLVMYTQPYLRERWLFFLALFIFVCGVPRRINPPTVIREAIGTALITDLLLWFQIGRVLTPAIIMICVGGFVLAELLWRAREAVEFRSGIDD